MSLNDWRLRFLVGPTAVGKTELSLRWAEANDAEILSCDAFCVYRGMDIGTAKPSAAERARVPHHGIDLVACDRAYSVFEYLEYAKAVVAEVRARGRNLLVCGGSGFYLKAFFAPVVDTVRVPAEVRERVRALGADGGLDALVAALLQLNPDGVGGLDLRNPRRVAAALERCMASGLSVMRLRAEFEAQPAPFAGIEKELVLLERPRADLHARVAARTRAMLEAGLIDEVRELLASGLRDNPTAARSIGYREVIEFLDTNGSLDSLEEAINANTRRLIRKQDTWFRTHIPVDHKVDAATATPETLFSR